MVATVLEPVIPALELRCPRCGCLVLRYRPPLPDAAPIRVETRCRRCHGEFSADLRADAPLSTLRDHLHS